LRKYKKWDEGCGLRVEWCKNVSTQPASLNPLKPEIEAWVDLRFGLTPIYVFPLKGEDKR
jgi:hypothetical protein